MIKKFVTALLVAAMLLVATSISWGAPGNGNGNGSGGNVASTSSYELLGATWE